ncbi:MAG TPA: 50S ribosomal protein L5 [Candidatus Nanoarchaeia archaeon]|nr:50S ribosomal protein L5 [Candidatus Nanoarchaeia archaeon]
MNPMRNIVVEKLTLNVGAGKDVARLEKGVKLIKHITGITPVKTVTNKRIQQWGLRPGLPIGTKVTMRGKQAHEFLRRLFAANDMLVNERSFDRQGNLAFGVPEYIDIPEVKYDPDLGIMGFEAAVTVTRPGYRVKSRRLSTKVGKHHVVTKQESIEYFTKEFGIKIGEKA